MTDISAPAPRPRAIAALALVLFAPLAVGAADERQTLPYRFLLVISNQWKDPASYVIEFSGFVKRNGLSAGQGAVHAIQLRRDGTLIMATRAGTDLTTGGEASTPVSITRLVNITAPSQVIDIDGFATGSPSGTSSQAQGTLVATQVGSATGAD